MNLRVAMTTLGCKANQADSAALTDALAALLDGPVEFVSDDQPADVVIVNTCTVTHSADSSARQVIRRHRRQSPSARILVTGCYAQTDAATLRQMTEVDAVVGNVDKAGLPEMVARMLRGEDLTRVDRPGHRDWNPTLREAAAIRSLPAGLDRPFVKVQDGCDYVCSFCIIPTARGASRSRTLEEVAEEVRRYEALGAAEIVLTGIHLGHWGRDLPDRPRFGAMLESLLQRTDSARFRVSSLEPNEVDEHVIELVSSHPRVCPHLHVPLQSGDDGTLARMRRVYRRATYERSVSRFRARLPRGAWGADVMVGFPGESDAAFESSFGFIESLDVSYLHVFPFSPRRGTPAATLPDRVPPPVARERARRLLSLSDLRRASHAARSVGTVGSVIVESALAPTGERVGFTENYVPVHFEGSTVAAGRLVRVHIESTSGRHGKGRLEEGKSWEQPQE